MKERATPEAAGPRGGGWSGCDASSAPDGDVACSGDGAGGGDGARSGDVTCGGDGACSDYSIAMAIVATQLDGKVAPSNTQSAEGLPYSGLLLRWS